jgi:acyl-[acyl-carrier-protein]-phospholipid O-acyltransferase/long-chain-fatty-acid--[acyl-carrier-protein] ligase
MSETTEKPAMASLRPVPPGYWALVATQMQGAFNDNLYRWIIIYYLLRQQDASGSQSYGIIATGAILFSIAYLIAPGIAGATSDRFSKRRVIIATKVWEVGVMMLGFVAFQMESATALWTVWFFMSLQSAFFSPAKFGILPEIVPASRLSWANGVMQFGLFISIISGTILAGWLVYRDTAPVLMCSVLVSLSAVGFIVSLGVPRVAAAAPERSIPRNPWGGLAVYLRIFLNHPTLAFTLIGATFFWFIASLAQQNIVAYNMDVLKLDERWSNYFQAAFMIGSGVGSFAAGVLSRRKIELGLVPIGLAGMALCAFLLVFPNSLTTLTLLIVGLSFSGGFYEVPIQATLQHRSPLMQRGGLIATWNVMTCLGILAAGAIFMAMGWFQGAPWHLWLFMSILSTAMLTYVALRHPLYIIRAALWLLTNTLYRLRALGRNNIPTSGPALLVANHSSFFGALVILGCVDRPIRFVISKEIYEVPWIRPLAGAIGAIPASAVGGADKLAHSFRRATKALRAGEVVCIFAEGQVTRTGHIMPFRNALERITTDIDVPVIPVHMDRLWGTVVNFTGDRIHWKLPSRIPYPILVIFGAAMASDSPSWAVRTAVQELGTEAYDKLRRHRALLHHSFIRVARRHPFRMAVVDQRSGELSYFKTLVGAIALGRKLQAQCNGDLMVGLLVPPSVGGALANIALQILGKTPVNLNYTASNDALESCAEQCQLNHVITSRAFLGHLPNLEVPAEPIYLEDLKVAVSSRDRLVAAALAIFCPIRLLERFLGARSNRTADDVAAIIFSSGSSGDPKGIMLTHRNITSNVDGALQVFPHLNDDRIMGILPFFHSFGFMGTLWLPLSRGFTAIYHPSPLDAKAIGELVHQYRARFMFATPTFLQGFIRRCQPEQFESLVYVITGAEKLTERVRRAFKNKFGRDPLEGYGCTECAPVVAVNIPDFKAPGYYRVGVKHGTIGHPVPGVTVRIVDTDSKIPLTNGAPGVLQVKGPNVMRGYLGQPEKTADVLRENWYDTDNIACIDDDGFITITDRLSRFSKIAGEMVPHARIEEALQAILRLTDQQIAIAGVADEAKGERLVVLHTLDDGQLSTVLGDIDKTGLPNLWRPRPNAFHRIDELPVLGTGKLDLQALKKLARSLDQGE